GVRTVGPQINALVDAGIVSADCGNGLHVSAHSESMRAHHQREVVNTLPELSVAALGHKGIVEVCSRRAENDEWFGRLRFAQEAYRCVLPAQSCFVGHMRAEC